VSILSLVFFFYFQFEINGTRLPCAFVSARCESLLAQLSAAITRGSLSLLPRLMAAILHYVFCSVLQAARPGQPQPQL
ncbi:MAG: hypothetical protein WCO97_06965, partial [bacterium]